jgi:hypothetical protein
MCNPCPINRLLRALIKVNEDKVASSWKDSLISGRFTGSISEYLTVPKKLLHRQKKAIIENIQLIKFGPLEVTLDGIMVTGFGELGDLSTKCLGCRLQENKQT